MPSMQQCGLADGDIVLAMRVCVQQSCLLRDRLSRLVLPLTPHVVDGHLLKEEHQQQHQQHCQQQDYQQHLCIHQCCPCIRPLSPLTRVRQLSTRGAATRGARPKHVGAGKPGEYSALQYSTVQYSTVQYSTVQCSAVQYSVLQVAVYRVVGPTASKLTDSYGGQHSECSGNRYNTNS